MWCDGCSILGVSEGGEWVSETGEVAPEPEDGAEEGEWFIPHYFTDRILWCLLYT